jgi:hypothetical protein
MKNFTSLVFKEHKSTISDIAKKQLIENGMDKDSIIFKEMKQALITFDNGYKMSILFGEAFYSNGKTTYEAWSYEYEDEPRGYLTIQELNQYMYEVQSLKDISNVKS